MAWSAPQLTIASADFENQGAHHLAKTHDPFGKRTIGQFPIILL